MIPINYQRGGEEKEHVAGPPAPQSTTSDSDTSIMSSSKEPKCLEAGLCKGDDMDVNVRKNEEQVESASALKRTASNVLTRVSTHLTTRSIVDPGPPPDGGIKAWTQVACGWLVIFTTWGYVNSFGAFQTYYTETLTSVSPSTISWIGSVQVWLTFFVGAFSGRMLDAGLFVPTFFVGCIIQLLGIFMMSLSTKYWQLLITQGVMTGLGGGIFFCPAMGLVTTWFSTRRPIAVGLATTGNAVGGMIYPVLARELLPRIGFAWTARVLGFMNLAALCVVGAFMRPRLPPRKSGPLIDLSALREPAYVLFTVGIGGMVWATYYVFYYLSSFGVEIVGMTFGASTMLVVIVNGVGLPARVLVPFLAQRFGCLNTLLPVLYITALLTFLWALVHSVGGLYAWTVMYGISNASFQCLIPTTVASLTKDLNMVGTRLGMTFSFMSLAALTGPPIGGAIINAVGGGRNGYVVATMWAAVSSLVATSLMLTGRIVSFGKSPKTMC